MTFTTTVSEIELDVDYTYCPSVREDGRIIPAAVIIDKVNTKYSQDITSLLSESVMEQLNEEAEEHYSGMRMAA